MSQPSDCHEKRVPDECKPCELTCLERPRYFCGQLLTEEDLAAEQRYQREQNKLHNRHLHGWGVVCGLEVACHPKCSSKGNVLIKKGHAIDCCGNDIIVCKDDELNIIKKIEECRPKPKEDECLPGADHTDDKCKGSEKKYCLIIKYKEKPSRPVTALIRDDEGCSVKRCEPSRIKEGYDFDVKECKDCNKTDRERRADILEGMWKDSMWERISECESILPEKPFGEGKELTKKNHDELLKIYCDAKDHIRSVMKTHGHMVHCDIRAELDEIKFPDRETEDYGQKITAVYRKLGSLLVRMVLDCACLKSLYICPECKKDDRVVLACITVQGDRIKNICNLSRRQVMTFPKLFYWLPINEVVWRLVKYICCELDILDLFPSATDGGMLSANNLAAIRMVSKAMKSSVVGVSRNFVSNLKGPGVSVGQFSGRSVEEVENILAGERITVREKVRFEPSLKYFRPEYLLSGPLVISSGSEVVIVHDKNKKVMGIRYYSEVEDVDVETIKDLRTKYDTLRADLDTVKSSMISMRRDPDSTIELKANIDKAYLPLTIELVKAFTKEMPPEVLKDIDKVRGGELKGAGMRSVSDVLKATTAAVSAATKEPVPNATKYIDNAENKTLEVAREISSELKRVKATKKEDLLKKEIDTKGLAKKLKLPEETVKKVFSDISKIK